MFTDESQFKVFYIPNSRNDTVWGSQEGNVPRADQIKFSPSVMVWGGMTGHGLTDLHFVPQGVKINSDYYIDNILKNLAKAAFNDTVVQRMLFSAPNTGLFQQPDTLTNLMNSMPGRMRDVIKMKGNTVR